MLQQLNWHDVSSIVKFGILLTFCDRVLLLSQRSDYINASFMDGYKQKNAYIGTQGTTS